MVLARVIVDVKLTNNGVSSDSEKKFKRVEEKDVLTESFVGFATQEIAIKGKAIINEINCGQVWMCLSVFIG